jgi:hypothetical protein
MFLFNGQHVLHYFIQLTKNVNGNFFNNLPIFTVLLSSINDTKIWK